MAAPLTIVAYEHQLLRVGSESGLREAHLAALARLQQRHAVAVVVDIDERLVAVGQRIRGD